jgi:hypothetical protein
MTRVEQAPANDIHGHKSDETNESLTKPITSWPSMAPSSARAAQGRAAATQKAGRRARQKSSGKSAASKQSRTVTSKVRNIQTKDAAHDEALRKRIERYPTRDELEGAYQTACELLRNTPESERNYTTLAEELNLSMDTLRRRFLGSKPSCYAHENQQILTTEQQDVLAEWIMEDGDEARPYSRRGLIARVFALTGTRVEESWCVTFEYNHPDLVFSSPNSLDPKRAQAFNRKAVRRHFKELKRALKGVKPENIYNMDEQGLQLGGGRKRTGRKYYFRRTNRSRYRFRAADLELVTVIDTVSADGTKLTPSFIFSGKHTQDAQWYKGDEESCDVTYVIRCMAIESTRD